MNQRPSSRKSSPFASASEILLALLLAVSVVQISLSFSAAGSLISRTSSASDRKDISVVSTAHTNSPTNAGFQSKPSRS